MQVRINTITYGPGELDRYGRDTSAGTYVNRFYTSDRDEMLGAFIPGRQITIELDAYYATREEAQAALAALNVPKFVGAHVWELSGYSDAADARQRAGDWSYDPSDERRNVFKVGLGMANRVNETTGTVNETARKRWNRFVEAVTAA